MLRGVKPEASLTIDGGDGPVGGLTGQPDYAYLQTAWLDRMKADEARALHGLREACPSSRGLLEAVRYAAIP